MPKASGYQIRGLGTDETSIVGDTVYRALDWNPDRPIPATQQQVLEHPELKRYHHQWGRDGDLAVVATLDDLLVGAAFCRLFSEADHGAGYLDPATPELAVAVDAEPRGKGLGTRLVQALEERAKTNGFRRLSLSVDAANPAVRLYERLGYEMVDRAEGSMVKILAIDD